MECPWVRLGFARCKGSIYHKNETLTPKSHEAVPKINLNAGDSNGREHGNKMAAGFVQCVLKIVVSLKPIKSTNSKPNNQAEDTSLRFQRVRARTSAKQLAMHQGFQKIKFTTWALSESVDRSSGSYRI